MRVAVALLIASLCVSAELSALELGESAPNFSLSTASGERVMLSEFQGKPILVEFWTTWCSSCRKSLKESAAFKSKVGSDEIEVLAVNLDDERKTFEEFAAEHQTPFPLLYDHNAEVAKQYGPRSIPAYYLIDSSGKVRMVLDKGSAPDLTLIEAELRKGL